MPDNSRRSSMMGLTHSGLARLRASGMAGLLALLAFGIFVMPVVFPPGADSTSRASRILIVLILICGIAAISEHRRLAASLAVLAAGVIAARLVERAIPALDIAMFHDVLLLAALVLLAIAVGINVFASRRAVADRLFGAIGLYLLLGAIWATLYAGVANAIPNAFAGQLTTSATMFDWGYFSLVTLTTVGYGDITPVAHVARSLAALEALIGQLYPAIIIARLVSAHPTDA